MKALTLPGVRQVLWQEVDDPAIVEPTDAVVRVTGSAICGSDLHVYRGRIAGVQPGIPIGHEFVGIVEAVGSDVRNYGPGDRVTGSFFSVCGQCWACTRGLYTQCVNSSMFGFGANFGNLPGTQAERVRVPHADATLIAVPTAVGDEAAITVGDIASTAYFAVDRANIHPGDTIAVVGLGPVGLLAVEMAFVVGAARVIALDLVPDRLAMAEQLGAIPVSTDGKPTAAIRDLTGGRGADAAIEAVGSEASLSLVLRLVCGFATVSTTGVFTERDMPLAMGRLFQRDLTLRAGMCNVPAVAGSVMALIEAGRIHPERLFSHRLPLSRGVEAYELFDQRRALKVFLTPED